MGDRIIITEEEPKPDPQIIVVKEKAEPKVEKIVTEKTTTVEKQT